MAETICHSTEHYYHSDCKLSVSLDLPLMLDACFAKAVERA